MSDHRPGPTEPDTAQTDTAQTDTAPTDTAQTDTAQTAQLFDAVGAGDVNVVRQYLDAGLDPDVRDSGPRIAGRTPLITATLRQEAEIVDLLLAAGADPNLRDREKARRQGHLGCLRWNELGRPHTRGLTALMMAAAVDDLSITRRLLAAGADPGIFDDTRHTALAIACFNGHSDVAFELLDAGADLEARLASGKTCLLLALDGAHSELALRLLEAGARWDVADQERDTALHFASIYGLDDVVLEILRLGGDPTKRNRDDEDVLEVDGGLSQSTRAALRAAVDAAGDASDPSAPAGRPESNASSDETPLRETPEATAEERERLRPERIREVLAKRASRYEFLQLAKEVASRLDAKLRDSRQVFGGYSLSPAAHVDVDLPALQDEFLPRGCFLLRSGAEDDGPNTLAALPVDDPDDAPHEALAAFGLAAPNDDLPTPADVNAWFRARPGVSFRVLAVTPSTLDIQWRATPDDPLRLAAELEVFCPDLLDQGFSGLDDLCENLAAGNTLHFYWS